MIRTGDACLAGANFLGYRAFAQDSVMPQGGTESRPSRPLETGGVRDEQKNRLLGLPLMMQRFGFKEDGLGFPGS